MTSRRTTPPTTRTGHAVSAGLLALVLVAVLGGCGFFDKGADARKEADALASGLTKGDVSKVVFTDPQARQQYAALHQALPYPAKVTVDQVTRSGGKADARLNWSVDLGGQTWKHQTHATLLDQSGKWRVDWKPSIVEKSLAANETLQVSRVNAQRGSILGRDDQPIVVPRPVIRFGIDRSQVPAAAAPDSARRLATLVGIAPDPYVAQVTKAGPKAFVQAIAMRHDAVPNALLGKIQAIPGARGISDHLPLAPTKEFAAAILGTVGPATKEIIDKSNGRLHVGDDAGLSGLQLRYDAQLGGTPGVKVSAVPATTKAGDQPAQPRVLFSVDPIKGQDLHTTLDLRLQQRADDLLAGVKPASALVAIQPSTGAILAAASGPGSKGYNTATFGRYAPGSTFKVVSALALLRSGLTPTSVVPCTPTLVVNGKKFKNYSDYPSNRLGQISLRDALANSCNTAFISQHGKLQGTALADAAAALGVGVDRDLGFPAYFGQVPPATSETEGAADMIGQGKVLASPMAMAAVVASVAKGQTVVPQLVTGTTQAATPGTSPSASPGSTSPSGNPSAAPISHPLTPTEADQLRAMMRAVVTEGSGTVLQPVEPPVVIAKTGTAEYGTTGPGGSLPTHAWMIAAQGDLAVAVFVDTGDSGSHTAGPILKAFLQAAKG
ncbi:MAG TPA: penicillin-binding transpeptidase domain-containing protein [Marmoricola sp.]|nr:penicillin-binding transpeptidase domain-containing protein [Marmoricola sp.]